MELFDPTLPSTCVVPVLLTPPLVVNNAKHDISCIIGANGPVRIGLPPPAGVLAVNELTDTAPTVLNALPSKEHPTEIAIAAFEIIVPLKEVLTAILKAPTTFQ